MFRKDESAARSWESFKCERCTQLQEPILNNADRMLKPGGTLVYSTCTFSPEEDEQMILRFMRQHEGYELAEIPKVAGIEGGRPQWAEGEQSFERAARLWPHRLRGEGHFVAKLVKTGKHIAVHQNAAPHFFEETLDYEKLPQCFHTFVEENMNSFPQGVYLWKGKNLYQLPETPPRLNGLKVAKFGWFLGTAEGERFEPSHSLVTALVKEAFKRTVDLNASDRNVSSYLRGETLLLDGEKGLTAVCVDGWTLGWAKQTGDNLKNLYPKGWRRLS
jgi:NOL1/NOP2/fmu family ribosome biogenesis protein